MNSKFLSGWRLILGLMVALAINQIFVASAGAVPAYARQTGQNCLACHAGGQFPELTPYGRKFKLTGYTLGSRDIPFSIAGVVTATKEKTPDLSDYKDAVLMFETGSVFIAGKVTDNIGLFSQYTYNNYSGDSGYQGTWTSDNFDLRFADRYITPDTDFIYGLSLNNNPSLTDVWNTAPAWIQYVPTQFGYTGPDGGAIVGGLGGQVRGIDAYLMWNDTLYAEIGSYGTANGVFSFMSQSVGNNAQPKLSGFNPYVRVALNHDWGANSLMIGAFAFNTNIYMADANGNATLTSGPTTNFRDRGVDAQYQYILDPHTVTAQFSYIRETINNGAVTGVAANQTDTLNSMHLKGTYTYQAKYGASLNYFSTSGSADNVLYSSPSAVPDTRGWSPEVFYIPIQNIRIGLQYYAYQKYDGASSNYDGNGRNARDNNTAFLYIWGAY